MNLFYFGEVESFLGSVVFRTTLPFGIISIVIIRLDWIQEYTEISVTNLPILRVELTYSRVLHSNEPKMIHNNYNECIG